MKKLGVMLILIMILVPACGSKQTDSRISVQEGVASDTAGSNIVTRPVVHAFSALIGERIDITNAVTRRNKADILELQVEGYNKSFDTQRFQYKVEWLDAEGFKIDSKASVWRNKAVTGKSNFTISATAPNANAVDFRMNTRDQE